MNFPSGVPYSQAIGKHETPNIDRNQAITQFELRIKLRLIRVISGLGFEN
jgi:hypothetical protein